MKENKYHDLASPSSLPILTWYSTISAAASDRETEMVEVAEADEDIKHEANVEAVSVDLAVVEAVDRLEAVRVDHRLAPTTKY